MMERGRSISREEEALRRLRAIAEGTWEESTPPPSESSHEEADAVLLDYIGDSDIAAAYEDIPKWHA